VEVLLVKVVLAEKPSVARDIAAVVGAKNKREGYFEGNDYVVTYAFGHLVTLAEPEVMNPAWGKPWRLAQLPMLPTNWKYQIVDKAKAQFNVIKKLFLDPKSTSIICATDAGREGEHIFRLIYMLSGSKLPVERLWISSLTAEAIKTGLAKLKSASEFDNLARAAEGRAHADWVVGLNFTRAYTTLNNQLCTIGRVQTPTLALIVERQKAIDSFQSAPFYELLATFAPGFLARYIYNAPGQEPQTRLQDKAAAQAILASVKKESHGTVESVVTSEKKTKAPALYDLLTLQKEANKRFGYTAQETLNIAQSLYEEHKVISYPRTESRHLSTDMVDELPRILSTVLKAPLTSQGARDAFKDEGIVPGGITVSLLRPRLNKSYVDDAKLTDHHAIIPTHNMPPATLPEKQKNVYQLVATRFLGIFLPPEVRDETTAIIKVGEHSFRAKGFVIKEPGWTVLDPRAQEPEKKTKAKAKTKGDKDAEGEAGGGNSGEDAQQLPPLEQGQQVEKLKEELKERKTSPPKPYDDSSLLTAMKNAGQELDDEDLASYMKQKGLGTPATRAAIIERLLQTGYVERMKKTLAPTAKGMALIDQVHADLKDIALTATWEQQLADMQDGKLPLEKFETDIGDFITRILPSVTAGGGMRGRMAGGYGNGNGKGSSTAGVDGEGAGAGAVLPPVVSGDAIGVCPQCKQGVVRPTPKGAGCSMWREGCKFSIWREQRGKKLTDGQIKDIVVDGKTKLIKGFKKLDGKTTYDGKLTLNADFKVVLEGPDGQPMGGGFAGGAGAAGGESGAGAGEATVFGQCPKCKAGVVRTTSKGVGCNRWREGCNYTIWREVAGLQLTDEQMKELFEKGRTEVIRGFKKKSGNGTFDAKLVMGEDFRTKFEFENAAGPLPGDKEVVKG
jgi:DNA topoisomerase-3